MSKYPEEFKVLEEENKKLQKQSDLLALGLLQKKNKNENLKKIIQNYGCHDYKCNESGKTECICGFEQALFLNSVTEHPDVQRLIKQVIRSDEKNKQLRVEIENKYLIIGVLEKECEGRDEKIKQLQAENKRLREAFGLARSMVLSGEDMTPQAKEIFKQALNQKGKKK